MFTSPKTILLLHSLISVLFGLVHADPPYVVCSNKTISPRNTAFQDNLNNFLTSLSSYSSLSNFYNNSTVVSEQVTLYGLFLCYKYVPRERCEICIATAKQDIQKNCPKDTEAIVWEESCQLQYSNKNFFGHLDVARNQNQQNPNNGSDLARFRSTMNGLLQNLTKKAAFDPLSGMYATGKINFTRTDPIYGFVQCTKDLSPRDCQICLETAILNASSCCYFSRGVRILSPGCYLRYEFYSFCKESSGSNSTENQSTPSKRRKNWIIAGIATGSAVLGVAILGYCVYCLSVRNQTKKAENQICSQEIPLHDISGLNDRDFLHQRLRGRDNLNPQEFPFIDLATLVSATNNFSDSNKLGEGGFGPVYKGMLSDGKEIAVKRLSTSSDQGSDEFINEVLLILKLQHKNLVRLLAFCIHGEEKLLIYEYMPNSSLDVFLFDPWKCTQLDWSRRLNIINGIAKGMLYLHEDSRLRIIHRDLKVSNVLLDSDMNPKISDFGNARIFGGSNCDANTSKIVGSYGYIAPEYAMEGLYSVKSDVFSFGVLFLEILTGKRNSSFHLLKSSPNLLAYAWQMWNEGKGSELMDPSVASSCAVDEFLRCLHISLLCVQEDAYDRPTMLSVAVMLGRDAVALQQPNRPAFAVGRFTDHYELNDDDSVNELTDSGISAR